MAIETTGLTDSGPILQTMSVDPYLARTLKMDGIVTVVDTANGPATLDAQFGAISQVAMADLIVLSKTDLVSSEYLKQIRDRLTSVNPGARVLDAVKGNGVTNQIWGLAVPPLDPAPVAPHDSRIGAASIILEDPDPICRVRPLARHTDRSQEVRYPAPQRHCLSRIRGHPFCLSRRSTYLLPARASDPVACGRPALAHCGYHA